MAAGRGGRSVAGPRAAGFAATVALEAEAAILFIGAGVIGILYYGARFRRERPTALLALAPAGIGTTKTATASTLGRLLALRGHGPRESRAPKYGFTWVESGAALPV